MRAARPGPGAMRKQIHAMEDDPLEREYRRQNRSARLSGAHDGAETWGLVESLRKELLAERRRSGVLRKRNERLAQRLETIRSWVMDPDEGGYTLDACLHILKQVRMELP